MAAPDKSSLLSVADPWPLARLLTATAALPLRFYARPAEVVARELLGCVLVHEGTAGKIVETEAYLGFDDLAAHSSHGVTDRTRVLFGPAGRAYVYFIYGMHECLNIVADQPGNPGCVLIRALEPLCGLLEMARRRHWGGPVRGLANGPGKLTEALAITRAQYGARLDRGPLTVRQWREPQTPLEIARGPRIGISQCIDWPLRFTVKGSPFLSKP